MRKCSTALLSGGCGTAAEGGVKDLADANLSLGIARLKAGDKAGAATAFDAAKGNPFIQRLAGYWKLRTR